MVVQLSDTLRRRPSTRALGRAASLVALALLSAQCRTATPDPDPTHERAAQEVARGRSALDAGDVDAALALFEDAARLDASADGPRVWTVRARIALGEIDEALIRTEALEAEGAASPVVAYLYGMAFAERARRALAVGGGPIIEMSFADAVGFLDEATSAEPETFSDAWPVLAEAAWYVQELELARDAGEQAVERAPDDPDAHVLLGRIALAQYVRQAANEETAGGAEPARAAAVASFRRAAELTGPEPAPARRADWARYAEACVQLGHAHAWGQELDEAADAYTQAIGADPSRVDFAQVRASIGAERFYLALTRAELAFVEQHGDRSPADATLLWWLGFARFQRAEHAAAEYAFLRSIEKWPAYTNAWYYVARSRYELEEWAGAAEALQRFWEADPEVAATTLRSDLDASLALVDWLVGKSVEREDDLTAANLSEIQAEVAPEVVRYWNNAGLFFRDAGERRADAEGEGASESEVLPAALYERSYEAYSRALELVPDDPAILNDAAVLLHYYLDRDLDRAASMYSRALERAEVELARDDLDDDVRELYETARRDARNNAARLAAPPHESGGEAGDDTGNTAGAPGS